MRSAKLCYQDHVRGLATAAFLVGFLATVSADILEMGPTPAQGPYPGFDVRYGVALDPMANPRGILNSPDLTSSIVVLFDAASTGEPRMEGIGDCHAIYDLPLEAFAATIVAQDGMEAWVPGILRGRVLSRSGDESLVDEMAGVSFLGIKISFHNRFLQVKDVLPGGGLGFRTRIVENLDGKVFESYTSWYLVPIVVDGVTKTYVRFFMRSGTNKPFLGEDAMMRAYMPIQFTGMVKAIAKEAKRRLGKG